MFHPGVIVVDDQVETEMQRLRQQCNITVHETAVPAFLQKLRVCFQNVRSLNAHYLDVKNDSSYFSHDLLIFLETKLPQSCSDTFQLPGYHMHTCSQLSNGIVIYSKHPPCILQEVVGADYHVVCFNVPSVSSPTFLACYRKQNCPQSKFRELLHSIGITAHILVGDFNEDLFTDKLKPSYLLPDHTWTLQTSGASTVYGSMIDHLWTRDVTVVDVAFKETYFSDHFPLTFAVG